MEIKNRFTGKIILSSDSDTLCGANLRGANLGEAYLGGADLRGANLRGADLRGAYLGGAVGNMKEVFSMQLTGWRITFTKDVLCIGCQQHSISSWCNFSDSEIENMDSKALDLWKEWKDFIFLAIEKTGVQK